MGVRELFELTDKKAMVTGGAGGIGMELCAALAEMGSNVAVVDVHRENLRRAAVELKRYGRDVITSETDVTDAKAVENTVKRVLEAWDRIDILVNCAGIGHWAPAEDMKEEDWDRVIAVNLKGTFLCCQAVGRNMIANRSGKIINIASMSGTVVNRPQLQIGYNASKAGVIMLTKSLAAEWARYNINVNCISPGYIATELTRKVSQYHDQWRELTPFHRLGEPSELKGTVVYLASDASNFMTGANLIIDGGYTVW